MKSKTKFLLEVYATAAAFFVLDIIGVALGGKSDAAKMVRAMRGVHRL